MVSLSGQRLRGCAVAVVTALFAPAESGAQVDTRLEQDWESRFDSSVGPPFANDYADQAFDMARDSAGNVFIVGRQYNTDLGAQTGQIVKVTPAGVATLFAQSSEGQGSGSGLRDIAVDGGGNVYVAGYQTAGIPPGNTRDLLLDKYAADGTLLWRRTIADTDTVAVAGGARVLLDGAGNAYLVGVVSTISPPIPRRGYAVARYDAAGNLQWSRVDNPRLPTFPDSPGGAAFDSNGNLNVVGTGGLIKYAAATGAIVCQDVTRAGEPIAADAAGNVFTATTQNQQSFVGGQGYLHANYATTKYDATCVAQWTQQYDGELDDDFPSQLRTDAAGAVVVAGRSCVSQRPVSTQSCTQRDAFGWATVKYDANGVQQWVRRDEASDRGLAALEIDGDGSVYVGGSENRFVAEPFGQFQDRYVFAKYAGSDGREVWRQAWNSLASGGQPDPTPDTLCCLALDGSDVVVSGTSSWPRGSMPASIEWYDVVTLRFAQVPCVAETCNGVDDDCDAQIDDGFSLGNPCSVGTGACLANGVFVCAADAQSSVCNATPGSPTTEVCNGIDDDCDGAADDGNPGGGASCATGQPGVCAAGTVACTSAALQCIANVAPSAEVCNGLDDDCDGVSDDGNPGGGASCSTGQPGICDAGTLVCGAGALQCQATTSPQTEVCNGLDDDCDAQVDENVPGAPTWYRDADGDGFGTILTTASACAPPSGFVANDDDCDDGNPALSTCNTPVGPGPAQFSAGTPSGPVTVSIPDVLTGGDTSISVGACPEPPTGIVLLPTPNCVVVDTTATWNGNATVCIPYDETQLGGVPESELPIIRCEEGGSCALLQNVQRFPAENRVCGETSQFSFFAVGIPIDTDGDFFDDLVDNCPYVSNFFQQDAGRYGGDAADGVGNACQCGDLTGNGLIQSDDVAAYRAFLSNPAGSPLGAAALSKCSTSGGPTDCDVLDVSVIRRALEVPTLLPGPAQVCDAAVP